MILRVEGVTKAFGGVKAVDDVSFDIAAGTISALIGPNGAGKTTCFNVITGVRAPDEGRVVLNGVDITRRLPDEIAATGLARTFQQPRLFPEMTVLENVAVGCHLRSRTGAGFLSTALRLPSARQAAEDARSDALACLERVGLRQLAHYRAHALTTGQARLVELARAIAARPKLLLLDEPAAGLNEGETHVLGELLAGLRSEGLTILIVEHNMRLVMTYSNWIGVLNYGRKIAEGTPAQVQTDAAVLEAYLGTRELAASLA
ncbi:MAG: ABC transporter ATP-binding protein [Chloroflexi bacterium]|nr:ABC transporter ATP-binding protein [Chloroflexota bacterium]MBV9603369.1 ABC transporter ATP-binding protein [Chloroflexota bacterium]